MGDLIAKERTSTLAVKLELAALTGTASSTGSAVTGVATLFTTEIELGNVIGNQTSGYRTVAAIADATHLTLDSAFDVDLAGATIEKQAFGQTVAVTAADIIEWVPPFTFEPTRDEKERSVINRSFDDIEPVSGSETVTGNITVELHGAGTAGVAPESDALWQCAIGEKSLSTASTTITGSTTTSVRLTSGGGANFKVGQHISITAGAVLQCARITNNATDILTVSPALTAAPGNSVAVGAGVHYRTTLTELHSIYAPFWRGDITLEKYLGNKCSTLSLDFTSGELVNPVFTFEGQKTGDAVAEACTLGAATPDTAAVHVARYMVVKVGGTLYPLSNVKVDIANTLKRRDDVTTSGTKSIIRTARKITGSFSLMYENKAIEDAFKAGTTAELFVVSSAGNSTLTAGNIFCMSLPKIKYTAIPKSSQDGIYQYDVTFRAVRTNGEDAIWVSFV